MNILFLSWNYPPVCGGIEQVVGHLSRGLASADHDVRVVTAAAEDAPAEEGVFRSPRRSVPNFLWYAATQGRRLVRESRPDVIVCGSITAAPAAWVLSLLLRVPYAVLVHGSDILHGGALFRLAVRVLLGGASGVAFNSGSTQRVAESLGLRVRNATVVYPGVAERPAPAAGGLPDRLARELAGRRIILYVGRLVRRKGLVEFLGRVMPDLAKTRPEILFLVAGGEPTESLVHHERLVPLLESAIVHHRLSDHVRLLGRVGDDVLDALYRAADLVVLPGIDVPGDVEGFGIVLAEAALAGQPAVTTRTGGAAEAVEDGVTGLVVEPGDSAGLRDAILRLLDDDGLRARMGKQAAERARRELLWPVIVRRYAEWLEQVVASPRGKT